MYILLDYTQSYLNFAPSFVETDQELTEKTTGLLFRFQLKMRMKMRNSMNSFY